MLRALLQQRAVTMMRGAIGAAAAARRQQQMQMCASWVVAVPTAVPTPMARSLAGTAAAATAATEPPQQQASFEATPPTTTGSSTATETKKNTRRRKRRELPPPIAVTENAVARLKELLAGKEQDNVIGVRIGVKRRGCNGLSYTMNYAEEKKSTDEEVVAGDVRVLVDQKAVFFIAGTTMDFEETEMSAEFTFVNPNAKGECGCGESFNV